MAWSTALAILLASSLNIEARLLKRDASLGKNLIKNGGFEDGTWNPWDVQYSNIKSPGYTGKYYGAITFPYPNEGYLSATQYGGYPGPSTVAGGLYSLEFDLKLERPNCTALFLADTNQQYYDPVACVGQLKIDSPVTESLSLGRPGHVGKWQSISEYFISKSSITNITLFVACSSPTSNTEVAGFDNFALRRVSNQVYTVNSTRIGKNLITNPRFASGTSGFGNLTSDAALSITQPGYKGSKHALRIHFTDTSDAPAYATLTQQIQTVPGEVYLASLTWRTQTNASLAGGLTFEMFFANEAGLHNAKTNFDLFPVWEYQHAFSTSAGGTGTGGEWQTISGVIAAGLNHTVVQAQAIGTTETPFELGEILVQRLA